MSADPPSKQLQLPRWQFVGGGGEEFGDSVRTQRRHAFKIRLLLILLICGMTIHPGFAKGGKSIGHAYVKSAARPSGTSAKQAPHSGNQGPAKTDTAPTTVTHSGDRPSDIDTRITVQPRRLAKSKPKCRARPGRIAIRAKTLPSANLISTTASTLPADT
jgi:hypothetical protein